MRKRMLNKNIVAIDIGTTKICVLVAEVDPSQTDKYGIITPAGETEGAIAVSSVVEKPAPADAASNLALIGRYVLEPSVMDHLSNVAAGAGGEIQLTDGIGLLIDEEPVFACRYEGERFDVGRPLGFLKASLSMALARPDLGPELRAYMRDLLAGEESRD